jgi:hypothetical protein
MSKRIAGIVLLMGGLLFLFGVGFPGAPPVFSLSDEPGLQIQLIEGAHTNWQISSLLLGVAGLIVVVGLGLYAKYTGGHNDDQKAATVGYGAVVLAAVGALLWLFVTVNRATLEPAQLHGNVNINGWWYPTYAILTNMALIMIGYVLLRTGSAKWLVGFLIVTGALQLGLQIFTGDSIPAINYFPIIIMGIVLIIRPSQEAELARWVTGVLLILGSAVFLVGASRPSVEQVLGAVGTGGAQTQSRQCRQIPASSNRLSTDRHFHFLLRSRAHFIGSIFAAYQTEPPPNPLGLRRCERDVRRSTLFAHGLL